LTDEIKKLLEQLIHNESEFQKEVKGTNEYKEAENILIGRVNLCVEF